MAGEKERDPDPAAERTQAQAGRARVDEAASQRDAWSGFKFGCPGTARPEFELAPHNKL